MAERLTGCGMVVLSSVGVALAPEVGVVVGDGPASPVDGEPLVVNVITAQHANKLSSDHTLTLTRHTAFGFRQSVECTA